MTRDWRQTRLDHAITATILALFATAWFGWAHTGVPSAVGVWLDAASGVAGLVSTVDPAGVARIGGGAGLAAWAAYDLALALRR